MFHRWLCHFGILKQRVAQRKNTFIVVMDNSLASRMENKNKHHNQLSVKKQVDIIKHEQQHNDERI